MKKFAIPMFVMLFALASCGRTSPPNNTAPVQSDVSESNTSVQSNASENTSTTESGVSGVTAAYADDLPTMAEGSFDEFIDDDSEYQVRVAYVAEGTVTSFQYFPLQFADVAEDGSILFDMGDALYTADTLTAERPLVIGMAFPGDTPNRGFSYVDANGDAHYFAVTTSGEDGSLVVMTFEP